MQARREKDHVQDMLLHNLIHIHRRSYKINKSSFPFWVYTLSTEHPFTNSIYLSKHRNTVSEAVWPKPRHSNSRRCATDPRFLVKAVSSWSGQVYTSSREGRSAILFSVRFSWHFIELKLAFENPIGAYRRESIIY